MTTATTPRPIEWIDGPTGTVDVCVLDNGTVQIVADTQADQVPYSEDWSAACAELTRRGFAPYSLGNGPVDVVGQHEIWEARLTPAG